MKLAYKFAFLLVLGTVIFGEWSCSSGINSDALSATVTIFDGEESINEIPDPCALCEDRVEKQVVFTINHSSSPDLDDYQMVIFGNGVHYFGDFTETLTVPVCFCQDPDGARDFTSLGVWLIDRNTDSTYIWSGENPISFQQNSHFQITLFPDDIKGNMKIREK